MFKRVFPAILLNQPQPSLDMASSTYHDSIYHLALLQAKKIRIGSSNADTALRELLKQYGSMAYVYEHFFGRVSSPEEQLTHCQDLEAILTEQKILTWLPEREDLPPILYYRGNQQLLQHKMMAVVGTRRLSDELDKEAGQKIVQRLVDKDYCIISGLARGCDTLAHQTAINCMGKTIAVIGMSPEKYYPSENRKLQDMIASECLLLSPFPVGLRTFPSHFAYRNQIMVALSEGIVVIRADDKSGTQHAIRKAAEAGKIIYALKNNYGHGYEWLKKYRASIKVPNHPQDYRGGNHAKESSAL